MRFPRGFSLRSSTLSRPAFVLVAAALGSGATIDVSAEELALETITVTAQKREQSLLEVPMSVSALSASALEGAGVGDVEDISRQVPVLEVQSSVSPVMTNFRIRRVGNLGNIPTFEPAVGVFIDGAFDRDTLAKAVKAFHHFRAVMQRHHVARYRAVATAATREARNRRALISRIYRETGIRLVLQTDGRPHGDRILEAISAQGFAVEVEG